MDEEQLTATTVVTDGSAAITVVGQLDLSSVDVVREAIDQALAEGATTLVFDLAGLTFMDSTGLGVLAVAHTHAVARSGKVVIEGANELIRRLLDISGMAEEFEVR